MDSQKGQSVNAIFDLVRSEGGDELIRRISQLCMSNTFSDVVFIVEDQRISAHKCILAAGNKYFEDLLFGEMSESKQKEINLKVPLEAFKAILGYIYSGEIRLLDMEEDVLDILALANKYGLTKLEDTIIKYISQVIGVSNAWPIFQLAWFCDLEDLKDTCYTFMDRNASNLLAHESFHRLSKELLEDVLRRDSFLASEFEIFTAVIEWCKHHKEVDVDSVLSYVRLPLISLDDLLKARRSGALNEPKLIDVLEMKAALKKLPYRVWPNKNMVALEFGAKIIQGFWETDPPPPGNIFPSPLVNCETPYTVSAISYEGIVVELGISSIINHILIRLRDNNNFSYFVEVSSNESDNEWERIVDYRYCQCKDLQLLYFPPKLVKCMKIVGTRKTGLQIIALEAFYKITIPKQINGFIVATIEIFGWEENEEGVLQKGELFGPDFPHYRSRRRRNEVFRQLNQPYLVGSLRIYFSNDPNNRYEYSIDLSVNENNADFCTVVTKQDKRRTSWQRVSFPPQPVVFIRISSDLEFRDNADHSIHFEEEEEVKPDDDD